MPIFQGKTLLTARTNDSLHEILSNKFVVLNHVLITTSGAIRVALACHIRSAKTGVERLRQQEIRDLKQTLKQLC